MLWGEVRYKECLTKMWGPCTPSTGEAHREIIRGQFGNEAQKELSCKSSVLFSLSKKKTKKRLRETAGDGTDGSRENVHSGRLGPKRCM